MCEVAHQGSQLQWSGCLQIRFVLVGDDVRVQIRFVLVGDDVRVRIRCSAHLLGKQDGCREEMLAEFYPVWAWQIAEGLVWAD